MHKLASGETRARPWALGPRSLVITPMEPYFPNQNTGGLWSRKLDMAYGGNGTEDWGFPRWQRNTLIAFIHPCCSLLPFVLTSSILYFLISFNHMGTLLISKIGRSKSITHWLSSHFCSLSWCRSGKNCVSPFKDAWWIFLFVQMDLSWWSLAYV